MKLPIKLLTCLNLIFNHFIQDVVSHRQKSSLFDIFVEKSVKSWGKTAFFRGKALDLPGKSRYNDVINQLLSK